VLTLDKVRKSYGARLAVDDLSFEVRPGEVFGLLGPNGAGKSTTVSLAVGLLTPDAGRVDIGGHGPPTRPEVRARLGVAPQSLAIYEDLTAEENLRFFARALRTSVARGLAALVDRGAGTRRGSSDRREATGLRRSPGA
jgi:ABC-2 type transport system ATP-binding protein